MRMHIVSTLWETSAVSVIQDSLEMDTTAQVSYVMYYVYTCVYKYLIILTYVCIYIHKYVHTQCTLLFHSVFHRIF